MKIEYSIAIILIKNICLHGQSGTSSSIRVVDDHGPIERATVEIVGNSKTTTSSEGEAFFTHTADDIGTKQVVVITNKHEQLITQFNLLKFPSDNVHTYTITTRPLNGKIHNHYVKGQIFDFNDLPLDSVRILFETDNNPPQEFLTSENGFFYFKVVDSTNSILKAQIRVNKKGFIEKDQSITVTDSVVNAYYNYKLNKTRHSRSIYGYVRHGSNYLVGVNVTCEGSVDREFKSQTTKKPNKNNKENEPMFFFETDEYFNRKDSITLKFSKENYKNVSITLDLEDFNTNKLPLNIELNFQNKIDNLDENSVMLYSAIPFLKRDFFIGTSWERLIIKSAKRLTLGLNFELFRINDRYTFKTFSNISPIEKENKLTLGFFGGTIKYWLISPDKRFFSTYIGMHIDYFNNNKSICLFPYVGSRIFIHSSVALFFEAQYVHFSYNEDKYIFNPFGNSGKITEKNNYSRLLLNIGIIYLFEP